MTKKKTDNLKKVVDQINQIIKIVNSERDKLNDKLCDMNDIKLNDKLCDMNDTLDLYDEVENSLEEAKNYLKDI